MSDVDSVAARNAQLEAEVLAEIRTRHLLVHPVDAEIAVEHEGRAECPGMPDSRNVDPGVAEAALIEPKAEVVNHLRVEQGKFAPYTVSRIALPG